MSDQRLIAVALKHVLGDNLKATYKLVNSSTITNNGKFAGF